MRPPPVREHVTDDEDATLEEFLDVEEGGTRDDRDEDADTTDPDRSVAPAASDEEADAEPPDEATDSVAPDRAATAVDADEDVEEPAITSRWVPGGEECDRCTEPTERLWRADDGAFVCTGCAEWE